MLSPFTIRPLQGHWWDRRRYTCFKMRGLVAQPRMDQFTYLLSSAFRLKRRQGTPGAEGEKLMPRGATATSGLPTTWEA